MRSIEKFSINIEESLEDNFYLPPEDELNEFSDFEIGFRRFCFDHNHSIAVQIGDTTQKIHLYHDILDAIEEGLCKSITKLSNAEKITIDFNDFFMYMTPNIDMETIECYWNNIGTGESYHKILSLSNVLENLNCFINSILSVAVKKHYINMEDISKYLEWKLDIIYEANLQKRANKA